MVRIFYDAVDVNKLSERQEKELTDLRTFMREGGGFFSLRASEKRRYQELTGTGDKKPTGKPIPESQKKSNTVNISREELDGLVAKVEALEAVKKETVSVPGQEQWEEEEDSTSNRTATLRKRGEDYMIGWNRKRKNFNENSREVEDIYTVEFLKPDNETYKEDMVWVDHTKFERENVVLIDKDVKKLKKVIGTTRKVKVNFDKYKSEAGGEVPMVVKAEDTTFTCRLVDGRDVKLNSNFLNA